MANSDIIQQNYQIRLRALEGSHSYSLFSKEVECSSDANGVHLCTLVNHAKTRRIGPRVRDIQLGKAIELRCSLYLGTLLLIEEYLGSDNLESCDFQVVLKNNSDEFLISNITAARIS